MCVPVPADFPSNTLTTATFPTLFIDLSVQAVLERSDFNHRPDDLYLELTGILSGLAFDDFMDLLTLKSIAYQSARVIMMKSSSFDVSHRHTPQPSSMPTTQPTTQPIMEPTGQPSRQPSGKPSLKPSSQPSSQPSSWPSARPSAQPFAKPSAEPSRQPTGDPTSQPSELPSGKPTEQPTSMPSSQPTGQPSVQPTRQPFSRPSSQPSSQPSRRPTGQPSRQPSSQPTGMFQLLYDSIHEYLKCSSYHWSLYLLLNVELDIILTFHRPTIKTTDVKAL